MYRPIFLYGSKIYNKLYQSYTKFKIISNICHYYYYLYVHHLELLILAWLSTMYIIVFNSNYFISGFGAER